MLFRNTEVINLGCKYALVFMKTTVFLKSSHIFLFFLDWSLSFTLAILSLRKLVLPAEYPGYL